MRSDEIEKQKSTLKFYEENLKKAGRRRDFWEWVERISIYIILAPLSLPSMILAVVGAGCQALAVFLADLIPKINEKVGIGYRSRNAIGDYGVAKRRLADAQRALDEDLGKD